MKKYLVSLTLAVATGYGFGASDLFEAQAISVSKDKNVCIELGAGAATTFEAFLLAQLCPQVDTDFNLTSNTCTVNHIKQRTNGISESWDSTTSKWKMCTHPTWPGQFVGDEP
jgi:hypothetical protein